MSKVSKDFLKFRQFIRSNNLSVKEQFLLEYLFEFHNVKIGYAWPKFEDMLEIFNTTCRNTISDIIKHLEELGILKVDRNHKNNRYYIININSFINGIQKKEIQVEGQTTIKDFIEEDTTENEKIVADHTGFGMKAVRKLLFAAKNKVNKVIEAFDYSKSMNPNDDFAYTLWSIKNGKKKIKKNSIPFVDNCEGRNYDDNFYRMLEEAML